MSLHIPTRFHVTTVVGLQYGDEGKGKIVQELASSRDYDIIARFNGGPNAGHTMYYEDKHKVVTNVVPSGVLSRGIRINFIGPGCVVDPVLLRKEIQNLIALGINHKTIYLSELVPLVTPYGRRIDAEMNKAIGTTGRGIGPTYAHKKHRIGINVAMCLEKGPEEVVSEYFFRLADVYRQDWIAVSSKDHEEWIDSMKWILENINIAKKNFFFSNGEVHEILGRKSDLWVLGEGAQSIMLDNTYGTYPYVTSSNCLPSAIYPGLGLPGKHTKLEKVIGVFKAYNTRVGGGPFSTEVFGDVADKIRAAGGEIGSTTKRSRRIGWIDLEELQYSVELSGATDLYMTKTDILSSEVVDEVRVCVSRDSSGKPKQWRAFPPFNTVGMTNSTHITGSLQDFIAFLEESLGQRVPVISNGPLAGDLVQTLAGS